MRGGTAMVAASALCAALVLCVLAGCGGGGQLGAADKAGAVHAPRVLRLASAWRDDRPYAPTVKYFARQVDALSGGKLRVDETFWAAGNTVADIEPRVVRMVRDGRYDLGWVGTRAWDELGVHSFQALQAPFLITTDAVLDKVVTSRLAGEMLAGVERDGVIGVALIPDLLRHPVGIKRPLTSLADFHGARVEDVPSKATDALLRALGAIPVHLSDTAEDGAIAQGRIDGQELELIVAPGERIATGNIVFFPRVDTLFANRVTFAALSSSQRRVLRTAAARTLRYERATRPTDRAAAALFCAGGGRVVLASTAELMALQRAARPVYALLERDAQTRRLIAEIRVLKRSVSATPGPSACGTLPTVPVANATLEAKLNGTYRWVITLADVFAKTHKPPSNSNTSYPQVSTLVLRDGKWFDNGGDRGTYTVAGDHLALHWPPSILLFTFTVERDGSLKVAPVRPMDPGDAFIWTTKPWRRLGPPVASLP
jgi:TRAP-type C4-dicarboxylate transport system substrate-binding protein